MASKRKRSVRSGDASEGSEKVVAVVTALSTQPLADLQQLEIIHRRSGSSSSPERLPQFSVIPVDASEEIEEVVSVVTSKSMLSVTGYLFISDSYICAGGWLSPEARHVLSYCSSECWREVGILSRDGFHGC